MRVSGAVSAGAVGAMLCTSVAGAEPKLETYRLAWTRGEGAGACPSEAELARAVKARLRREPFADTAERSIEGTVTHEGDTWHAELRVRDVRGVVVGSRTLETTGEDCAAATIGPEGGTVSLSTPVLPFTANFYPKSLTDSTVITLTELAVSPPDGFVDYSPVYELAPLGIDLVNGGELDIYGQNSIWAPSPALTISRSTPQSATEGPGRNSKTSNRTPAFRRRQCLKPGSSSSVARLRTTPTATERRAWAAERRGTLPRRLSRRGP